MSSYLHHMRGETINPLLINALTTTRTAQPPTPQPHHHTGHSSASSVTMFLGWVCVRQRHNKTREIPLQNFCNVKNSGMGFLLSSPLRHYRLISGANIFIHHYLRQASAMTFSLRAMKSESALPLSRPLERRARSITCLRMSLPAAYSSTTA